MLFASTSLAARIERAECRQLSDSAGAAARRHPGTGVFATPLAGGVATFTAPGSPLNKVAGLGFAEALDEGELEAVERAFAERGSTRPGSKSQENVQRHGFELLYTRAVLVRSA